MSNDLWIRVFGHGYPWATTVDTHTKTTDIRYFDVDINTERIDNP